MAEDDQDPSDEAEIRDIAWCAAKIEAAAASNSRYTMVEALRASAGSRPYADLPSDMSDEPKAMCWAFDYHVEIDAKGPRHVHIEQRLTLGDRTEPPLPNDVPQPIQAIWADLVARVEHPAAASRLNHVLFEIGGRERQRRGADAVDAYVKAAEHWDRELDSLEDLRIGERLAHAIGDTARAQLCLEKLLDLAEQELAGNTRAAPGIVLRALEHVTLAPECPARVDPLLERAANELPDVRVRNDALAIIQRRCSDEPGRQAVWRRRVEAFLQTAEATDSKMLRLVFRQQALELAELSGMPVLRELAAGQLQSAREDDLGLIRFEFTSTMYDELAERVRLSFMAGNDWPRALISFAKAGPLSGDFADNSAAVEADRAVSPLRFLMPQTILGPDQLPILNAVTEDEKFQYEMVVRETQTIQSFVRPLLTALHDIVAQFGLPTVADLAGFLATWPSANAAMVTTVVKALHRFWAGDTEAATYVLVPQIECHIRQLILATSRGIFKLQTTHAPGQYPGLGAMLGILPQEFDIDESRVRFLKAVLVEPAGFNLRNQLAHGMAIYHDPATAAVAIHVALFLLTLEPLRDESTAGRGGLAVRASPTTRPAAENVWPRSERQQGQHFPQTTRCPATHHVDWA